MRYFENKLQESLDSWEPYDDFEGFHEEENYYINPDELWVHTTPRPDLTFTHFNGKLYHTSGSREHILLLHDLPKLDAALNKEAKTDPTDADDWRRKEQEKVALFGRTGVFPVDFGEETDDRYVIAFWNTEPDIYSGGFEDCVSDILKIAVTRNLPVFISSPLHGVTSLEKLQQEEDPELAELQRLSDEQEEQIRKMKELHTMPPAEKKAARKELGLAGDPQPTKSQQYGMIPGQKWWAPFSEDNE